MIVYHAGAAFKSGCGSNRRPAAGARRLPYNTPRMEPTRRVAWTALAVASVAVTLLAWLLDSAGREIPIWLSRALVLWTLGCIAVGLFTGIRRRLRADHRETRLAAGALLALTALSFVARFVGLDFELTTHFHNDEGIFLEVAREMRAGDLLPTEFHYPHLLYYLSAMALWLGDLFPAATARLAGWLFGVAPQDTAPLLLRLTAASLGALTTVPVFVAARRVAGLWAALFAGGLIALSPTYNEVSQLAISDVPSGFFAAVTLAFAANLLERESLRDYLLAGAAAALAAASKYPAGVSAVAIVAVWVHWRIRRRDFNGLLVSSGLGSVATLLAVMPALWLRFESVFGGPGDFDILFGYRQYAGRGWIGVVADSNVLYYLDGLLTAFGVVAVLLGAAGLFLLGAESRRRALVMAVFPLLFLALLLAMNVAVKRNLQPLLPAAAVVLGAGLAAWPPRVERLGRRSTALVLGVLFLGQPAFGTLAWDVSRVRAGTRELAVEWIDANVPQGAAFVKEAYTPALHFRRYAWTQVRYAGRLPLEEIRDPRWDYLLLARNAHLRFLDPEKRLYPHHEVLAERYQTMFDELELVRRFRPGTFRSGPDLLLYRLDPEAPAFVDRRAFTAGEVAHVSDPALAPRGKGASLRFSRAGQSAVFKEHLDAGRYRVSIDPQPPGVEGWLYVVTRDNREVGEYAISWPAFEVALERRDKYFLRVFLSPGGELRTLDLVRLSGV